MQLAKHHLCFIAVIAAAALTGTLWAGEARPTIITVEGMQCPSCAKKIVKTLSAVPGVAQVKVDMQSASLAVTPQPRLNPSPRGLWEAVERAGYHPASLEGPLGSFSAKPQR